MDEQEWARERDAAMSRMTVVVPALISLLLLPLLVVVLR